MTLGDRRAADPSSIVKLKRWEWGGRVRRGAVSRRVGTVRGVCEGWRAGRDAVCAEEELYDIVAGLVGTGGVGGEVGVSGRGGGASCSNVSLSRVRDCFRVKMRAGDKFVLGVALFGVDFFGPEEEDGRSIEGLCVDSGGFDMTIEGVALCWATGLDTPVVAEVRLTLNSGRVCASEIAGSPSMLGFGRMAPNAAPACVADMRPVEIEYWEPL